MSAENAPGPASASEPAWMAEYRQQCAANRVACGEVLLGSHIVCEVPAVREEGRIGVCGRGLTRVQDQGGNENVQITLGSPRCAISTGTVAHIDRPEVNGDYL